MASLLEQLKQFSTLVCDSEEVSFIKKYGTQDVTTNPTLILQAVKKPEYQSLVEEAVYWGLKQDVDGRDAIIYILDKLLVNFGKTILKEIPGRVSVEVDARLSFNMQAMVQRGMFIAKLFENEGIPGDRFLIKVPATWEGICAAQFLETQGIKCNVTLVLNLIQAVAAANAKVTLVSPFVGRVLDWWQKYQGKENYSVDRDPGVISVMQIYSYYKKFQVSTEIMAASFRNIDQILALAGCDFMTISPKFLEELAQTEGEVVKKLEPSIGAKLNIEPINLTESAFRYLLNDDAMATEKLSEGIRLFSADTVVLENSVVNLLQKLASEKVN
ncbi:MAG: transaldolase [Victivallaceae bacterium]